MGRLFMKISNYLSKVSEISIKIYFDINFIKKFHVDII